MTTVFEHKKLAMRAEIKTLTQGDVEKFFEAYHEETKQAPEPGAAQRAAMVVRAAIRSGWLVGFEQTAEDVANMMPAKVAWLAGKIDGAYEQSITIPPEV